MNASTTTFMIVAILTGSLVGIFVTGQQASQASAATATAAADDNSGFTDDFFIEDCHFSATGSNRFFILQPGYKSIFRGVEDGEKVELTITVTDKTKIVDGIQTRVVVEKETHDGEVVEISNNYFAICKETNSAFYFGEDTDIYENGKIVSHDGSWLAGQNKAEAGLVMPGIVLVGSKFQQEIAPNVAMDRSQIVSMEERVNTPDGSFDDVVKSKETTPLEPTALEYKYYAAGVGLIQDDVLKLVKHGFN
jgi:hypothetical protein